MNTISVSDNSTKISSIILIGLAILLSIVVGISSTLSNRDFIFYGIAGLSIFLIIVTSMGGISNRSYYCLVLTIISTTIARETLGTPVETDIAAVMLLIISLIFFPKKDRSKFGFQIIFIPLIGFLSINFLTAYLNSPVPDISYRQSFILSYRAITFYLVLIVVRQYPNLRFQYLSWFQNMMMINVALGLLGLTLLPFIQTPFLNLGREEFPTFQGLFQEPNLLAIFTLCTFAISISQFVFSADKTNRYIWVLLFSIIGLIGCLTRSTWLGFVIVLSCLAIFVINSTNQRARKISNILIYCLVFCITLTASGLYLYSFLISKGNSNLISIVMERASTLFDTSSGSSLGRIEAWNSVLPMIYRHPWIGSGLLSFEDTNRISEGWLYNFVIQALHDSGAIGTFFLLWFYIQCLFYVKKAYQLSSNAQDKGQLAGYFIAQIALYFTSLFSPFTWSAFAWVLLGISVGHSAIIIESKKNIEHKMAHFSS